MGFIIKDEKVYKGGTRKWHLLSPYYMPDNAQVTFTHIILFNLPTTLWARHCFYFIDEEIESNRGEMTCPSLRSRPFWLTHSAQFLLRVCLNQRPNWPPLLRSEWSCRKGRKIRWWVKVCEKFTGLCHCRLYRVIRLWGAHPDLYSKAVPSLGGSFIYPLKPAPEIYPMRTSLCMLNFLLI